MNLKQLTICAMFALTLHACGGKAEEKKENKTEAKTEDKKAENTATTEGEGEGEVSEKKSSKKNKAVVSAKSGLGMREKAEKNAKLVELLPANSVVEVLEKGDEATIKGKKANWYKVKYNSKEGYAFGAYLKMGDKIQATSNATTKTSTDDATKTDFKGVIQKGLVTAKSGLTLREKASASGKSIQVVPQNAEVGVIEFTDEVVQIKDVHGSWCKVRYGRKEGYLFSGYLNFSTATVSAKSGLKLRVKPNKEAKQLTIIPSGAEVYLVVTPTPDGAENDDVVDDGSGHLWYKVRYGKFEGYAYGEFLEIEAGC